MTEVYARRLLKCGYQQIAKGEAEQFVRQTSDTCYIVQIIQHELSGQQLMQIRTSIQTVYREKTDRRILQMTVFCMPNSDFSEELRSLTSECSGIWLFAENEQRIYCYENQPIEFDGLRQVFEGTEDEERKRLPVTIKSVPWITCSIVFINVLCFIVPMLMGWYSQWIEAGCILGYKTLGCGQIYRLITGMFLHGSWNHLFNNMLVLCVLGLYLEPALGHAIYGIIYMGSGIFAGICSIMVQLMCDTGASVGASGAIFGLSGALLALVIFWKGEIPGISIRQVVLMCIFSLYNGFITPNVDNAAHIGGLVMGFLMTLGIKNVYKR